MSKYTVKVLAGDKKMDDLMHKADLFEPFKRLGTRFTIEVEMRDDEPPDLASLKKAYEDSEMYVYAIFIPGNPEGAWRDPECRVISDGQHWSMMDKLLEALNFVENPPESAHAE